MAGNRGDRRVRTVREKEKRLKKNRNESRSSSEGTRGRVRRQMHRRRVASTRNHCRSSGKMRSAIVCMDRGIVRECSETQADEQRDAVPLERIRRVRRGFLPGLVDGKVLRRSLALHALLLSLHCIGWARFD